MTHERFAYDFCIQIFKRTVVAIPFLLGRDPFIGYRYLQALIVLPNAGMRLLAIVFLKVDLPVAVQIFQGADLLCSCFCQEAVYYLMELFDFLSEYSDKKSYPQFYIIRTFPKKTDIIRVVR